jgi:hydrogenase maturation protease
VTLRAVVIGLGQPAAGDDGVGVAVIVRLRVEGNVEGVAYETIADASALVERLQTGVPVIIVDALVGGGAPGDVIVLDAEQLTGDARPLSTHGISVAQAVSLARAIAPDSVAAIVRIVGIVVERASVGETALSPEVAQAVPKACAAVHDLLREAMN